MFTINELYFSSVARKLACARQLYQQLNGQLQALPEVGARLHELALLSQALQRQMASMAMSALCRKCAAKPGGGCCSAFMAGETDAVLLLVNMLLGVEVAPQRDDQIECCFLGSEGCSLRVKPIFCLNYNCSHIVVGNEAERLKDLEKASAAVLSAQTALEKIVLARIFSLGSQTG